MAPSSGAVAKGEAHSPRREASRAPGLALVWGGRCQVAAGVGRRCPFRESAFFPLQSSSWRSVQKNSHLSSCSNWEKLSQAIIPLSES